MDFLSDDLDQYIIHNEDKNKISFDKSFDSYEGKTEKGKFKKDCWVIEKNNGLTPRDVTLHNGGNFWFQCDKCPHLFYKRISEISRKGKKGNGWCPYCAGKKLCGDPECLHCLDRSFASYQGKTENGKFKKDCLILEGIDETLYTIFISKNKDYLFNCDTCPHNFKSSPNGITSENGNWCPYCSKPCKKMCKDDKCYFCYQNSFSSYQGKTDNGKLKKDCWIIEKNGGLTSRDITLSCEQKYWFQCDNCPHQFNSRLANITKKSGRPRWCPYCFGHKLCYEEDCNHCYQRSFAGYNRKTESGKLKKDCWIIEKNDGLMPRQIKKGTERKFWFQCDQCPHQFTNTLSGVSTGRWCIYCARRKLCNDINCQFCLDRSFEGYEGLTPNGKLKKECWIIEKNGDITPRDIFRGKNKSKYWFKCDICNSEFESTVNQMTNFSTWCPHCVNKTEQMFQSWFKDNYEYKLQSQKRFQWCKNPETNRILPFDFCIPELKLIIEIDGDQHFRQVRDWKAPELQKERDVFKMNLALSNGYTTIRIYQPDIYSNRNNWDKETEEAIIKYDEPEIICIGRRKLIS